MQKLTDGYSQTSSSAGNKHEYLTISAYLAYLHQRQWVLDIHLYLYML